MAIVFIGQLLFSFLSFLFVSSLLFYQKERGYGSEILNACMSNQKKVIIQGEMGLFLTFSVFELQRGYLLVISTSQGIYADLSLAVGHVSECPHSGTRYFNLRDHSSITSAGLSTILAMLLLEENENKVFIEH